MAKISLRSYTREIENMIERGQTAEAIGHCKHILKTFPKHLETYRLLGKAFLESQRYTEAADVLERVLAAIPDDYIAHLGMSIIREDEGNLDAAIWHMERVFEVQPANAAFQTELRRLYGRRDGIEPPKIRLTRGALVRMYAKGELFPQATAEIRAALAEDPKRIDLEAILASVYYQAGRKVEATEICSRLVSKAPFNYEANRILADILPATSRSEDAKIYQSRLQAMDPYAAYISSDNPLSADVSDDAVLIERIDWQPAAEVDNQPAWTQSIGLSWDETPQQAEPDWMNVAKESEAGLSDSSGFQTDEQPQAAAQSENPLPDFLTGAGWTTSSEDLTAVPDTQIYADEQTPSESSSGDELAEADIPDWLAAMAPPTVQETAIEDSSRSEWLADILPPQESAPSSAGPDQTAPGSDTDWLAGLGAASVPDVTQKIANDATPDWLAALGSETPAEIEPAQPVEETTPDWLAALGTETPAEIESAQPTEEATPEWLAALGAETPAEIEPAQPVEEATPEWLAALGADETPAEAESVQPVEETTPEWLAHLGAETPAEIEPAQPAEEAAPEWLAALGSETPAEIEPAQPTEEATPEWLAALGAETPAEIEPAQPAEEAAPEWLATLGAETPAEIESVQPAEEAAPEWLAALGAETPAEVEPAQPAEEATPEWLAALGAETPAEIEPAQPAEEATPDWLAALGAETPAEIEPAQPAEEAAPEWLAALGADETPAETVPAQPAEEVAPEWLAALGAETPAEIEATQPTEEATPEWLAALGAETPAEAEPTQPAEEATPEWLAALGAETPAEIESAQPVEEATPEWLSELIVEEPKTSITPPEEIELAEIGTQAIESRADSNLPDAVESLPEPSLESTLPPSNTDIDSALAWLESLAVKQGADEDFLLVPADQRTTEAPDWVTSEPEASSQPPMDESGEAASQSVNIVPTEEIAAESIQSENEQKEAIPDWLSGLEETTEESIPGSEASVPGWEPAADTEQLVEAQAEPELPVAIEETLSAVESAESTIEITQPTVINPQPSALVEAQQPEVDMDAALAWLEGLAVKQGADSDFLFTTEDERGTTPPDWVNEQVQEATAEIPGNVLETLNPVNDIETTTSEVQVDAVVPEVAIEAELADHDEAETMIPEINIETAAHEIQVDAVIPEIGIEAELPTLGVETAVPEMDIESVSRGAEIEEVVSEIPGIQGEEMIDIVIDEIQPTETPAAQTTESDIDSALAWLEGLAAKQGADSDFLFVAEGDRTEKPPEWVEDQIASASTDVTPVEELPEVDLHAEEISTIMQPSDLAEKLEEASTPSLESSLLADEGTGVAEYISTQEIPAEQQLDIPVVEDAAVVIEEQIPAPEIPVAEKTIPDWLQTPQEAAQPEAETESVEAWLSTLTDKTPEPVSENIEAAAWEPEAEAAPEPPAEPIPQLSEVEIIEDPDSALETAEKAMYSGQIEQGLEIYNALIEQNTHLEETIHGLREALYRHPIDISIWQSLGDAYARNNSLQEALDAYTKAEELLR